MTRNETNLLSAEREQKPTRYFTTVHSIFKPASIEYMLHKSSLPILHKMESRRSPKLSSAKRRPKPCNKDYFQPPTTTVACTYFNPEHKKNRLIWLQFPWKRVADGLSNNCLNSNKMLMKYSPHWISSEPQHKVISVIQKYVHYCNASLQCLILDLQPGSKKWLERVEISILSSSHGRIPCVSTLPKMKHVDWSLALQTWLVTGHDSHTSLSFAQWYSRWQSTTSLVVPVYVF